MDSTFPWTAALSCCAAMILADGASAQIRHRYSFSGTGTVAMDSVGGANGSLLAGATLTGTGNVALDGTSAYVEMPVGLIAGLDAATFEVWYEWGSATISPWARLMDIGNNSGGPGAQGTGQTYLVLTPMAGGTLEHAGAVKTNPSGSSFKVYSGQTPSPTGLTHLAWTYDSMGDTMSIYVDGVLGGTVSVADNLTDIVEENNWLGRSQFVNDPYFNGTISEFRIYAGALTAPQVASSFSAGPDAGIPSNIGTSFCSATDNSSGFPGEISAWGQGLAAANDLTLRASNLPANQFGVFIVSRDQGFVPGPGSNGNLCVTGVIGIFSQPGQIKASGPGGEFEAAIDLTAIPQGGGSVAVLAGETWNFQTWHRDNVGTGSNFTNGVEIAFQ